ncbi:hypothetical protein Q8F55_008372 [Vanrija albida]|uniref:MARVEL domain-containing protein n=1 Tax=Vanrija albida TaxID=181172 RepID=A0ABR3PWG3_9TREE
MAPVYNKEGRKLSCMDKCGHPTITTILAAFALLCCALDCFGFAIAITMYQMIGLAIGLLFDLYTLGIAITASVSTIKYARRAHYPCQAKTYQVLKWVTLVVTIIRLGISIAAAALALSISTIISIIVYAVFVVHDAGSSYSQPNYATRPSYAPQRSYTPIGGEQPQQPQEFYAAPQSVKGYPPQASPEQLPQQPPQYANKPYGA